MRRIAVLVLGLAVSVGGCTNDTSLRGLGEVCESADECDSAMCSTGVDGVAICTTTCAPGGSCPPAVEGTLICNGEGLCVRPCVPDSVLGTGATREVCVDGRYQACSAFSAFAQCARCGCDPWGGGTCMPGIGCVVQHDDGEPCTGDTECRSGLCARDTRVCSRPRPMGEPCTVDAECETANCSNDGDTARTGVCNQPLGSPCVGGSDTCTACIGRLGGTASDESGYCSRARCSPGSAPNCPRFEGHTYECEESSDGSGHYCYETCTGDPDYRCYRYTHTCHLSYCY